MYDVPKLKTTTGKLENAGWNNDNY